MPSCCYPNCKMSFRISKKNHLGVKFYAFPANQTRKLIWLEAIHKRIEEFKSGWRVCSAHFNEKSFDPFSKKLLRTSVPTFHSGMHCIQTNTRKLTICINVSTIFVI